ncbi:MAG: hypothetical protein GF368_03050 [Candidatus Aenigmarchaeota archaeon]|nr:hypothetical protein [Candidatus Aenigmarchaeota archaeon]
MNKLVVRNKQPKYKYDKYGTKKKVNKQGNRPKSKKKQKKDTPFALKALGIGCIIVLFGFIVVLYINQFVQISTTNYQIDKLEKELSDIENKNEKIRLQIAQSQSLEKIENIARKELKMADPDKDKVYYISLENNSTNSNRTKNTKNNKEETQVVQGVADWFKNLTSVEAGTLDD